MNMMREKLIEILRVPIYPHELADPTEAVADYLLDNDVVPVVRCKNCQHSKLPAVLTQKYGEPGTLTCHNWHSPCNKRNVKQDDFCSYGERRTDG